MRTQKRTRLLSALMALLMVFSLLPASALAADVTSTWEAIDLADITPSDTVAITMTKDDATWALPAAKATGAPAAVAAAAADGVLTLAGAKADFGWTFASVEGGYQITGAGGQLYITANNNGVRVGTPEDAQGGVFSLSGSYLSAVDSKGATRFLGVYMTNPDWRCYVPKDDGTISNIGDQTVGFWKARGADAAHEA